MTPNGRRGPLPVSEAEFQSQVIELAQLRGWLVFHPRPGRTQQNRGWSTSMTGDVGYPDLTLARAGTVLFLELKSDRGIVTANQRAWLAELPDAHIVRPSDWVMIERLLR